MGDQKKNFKKLLTTERTRSGIGRRNNAGSRSASESQRSQQEATTPVLDSTEPTANTPLGLRNGGHSNYRPPWRQNSSSQSSRPRYTQRLDSHVDSPLNQNQQAFTHCPPSSNPQQRRTPTCPATTQGNEAQGQQLSILPEVPMERNPYPLVSYGQNLHAHTHFSNQPPHVVPTTTYLPYIPQPHCYTQVWLGHSHYPTSGQFAGVVFSHTLYHLPSGCNIAFTQCHHYAYNQVCHGYLIFPRQVDSNSSTLLPTNYALNYGNPFHDHVGYNLSDYMNHAYPSAMYLNHSMNPISNPAENMHPTSYHAPIWVPPQDYSSTWGNENASSQFSDTDREPLDLSTRSLNIYRGSNTSFFTNNAIHQSGEPHGIDQRAVSVENYQVDGAEGPNSRVAVEYPGVGDATADENISQNDDSKNGLNSRVAVECPGVGDATANEKISQNDDSKDSKE